MSQRQSPPHDPLAPGALEFDGLGAEGATSIGLRTCRAGPETASTILHWRPGLPGEGGSGALTSTHPTSP